MFVCQVTHNAMHQHSASFLTGTRPLSSLPLATTGASYLVQNFLPSSIHSTKYSLIQFRLISELCLTKLIRANFAFLFYRCELKFVTRGTRTSIKGFQTMMVELSKPKNKRKSNIEKIPSEVQTLYTRDNKVFSASNNRADIKL